MEKWEAVLTFIDFKRAVQESASPTLDLPVIHGITGPSYETVMDYLETLEHHAEWVSFDIETFGEEIVCSGLGYKTHEAICIPHSHSNVGRPYWPEKHEANIWKRIAEVLQKVPIIAQNAGFEWIYCWRHGIFPRTLFIDTMTLHHCLYPDFGGVEDIWRKTAAMKNPGHSLAFINSQYTRVPYYKDDRKIWAKKDLGGLSDQRLWNYNIKDVCVTAMAALQMMEEAKAARLWDYYNRRYIKPFPFATRAEWKGILIDVELRKKFLKEAKNVRETIKGEIKAEVGYELDVASPKKMAQFLYQDRKYRPRYHRKTHKLTTDKDTLIELMHEHNDVVLGKVISLKQIKDFISDVLRQPLTSDNRIHTHFKLGGTTGTRWSSGKSILGNGTNLQNVPTAKPRQDPGHDFLRRARALFLAD